MPISKEVLKRIMQTRVPSFKEHWLNERQNQAVFSSINKPLFIVAGPGTGKTTVLAIRILYLVFVEGFSPNSILATTFTRKAANELRSRVLSWGNTVKAAIIEETKDDSLLFWINSIDINQIITGTLDSIAQEAIENDRQPTEITPVIIDAQLANGFIRKEVLFQDGVYQNQELKQAISGITGIAIRDLNVPKMIKSLSSLSDRFIHDLVDLDELCVSNPQYQVLKDTIQRYWDFLKGNHLMDFSLLEQEFLQRALVGRLDSIRQVKAVFVDEFQDTNPLQEEIYYSLCNQLKATFTVVGDDDQSIYRFRGATVDIFSRFEDRIETRLGEEWTPIRVDLVTNYRSTPSIVEFSNVFLALDTNYSAARTPRKQRIVSINENTARNDSVPVLGMFRGTVEELSKDLAKFLNEVFSGGGHQIGIGKTGTESYKELLIKKGICGNWGDAVLLSSTANDFTSSNRERLPHFLRTQLNEFNVPVFNPRGRSITDIDQVRYALGLILLCLDNNGQTQNEYFRTRNWAGAASNEMSRWRRDAISLLKDESQPYHDELNHFVNCWASHTTGDGQSWPSEWPLVELLFTIMRWIPLFRDDPEGQIYLEVLARTITTAGKLSKYSGRILFDSRYYASSIHDIFMEVMLPIANREVDVDEEIMPNVPRDYFPIMTIHQAKGLEFPLVIVDVGSDYKINHPKQRFSRFPESGSEVHLVENALSPFSPIGNLRCQREELQRAFDDLRRLYFVADTRAQDVLLLVGLNSTIANNTIRLVQSGYSSHDGQCHITYKAHDSWDGTESADTVMLI